MIRRADATTVDSCRKDADAWLRQIRSDDMAGVAIDPKQGQTLLADYTARGFAPTQTAPRNARAFARRAIRLVWLTWCMGSPSGELGQLFDRCRADHRAWINGDAGGYVLPDYGSIFGAVGGFSLGGSDTSARQQSVAGQWLSGTGDLEFVNGAVSGDTAWLAVIERARVVFNREVGEQRWDLRVTEVFRRVSGDWERVHRHADPLVDRRSVTAAVQLLEPNN